MNKIANREMKNFRYDAPSVEVIEVEVESGFTASVPGYGDGSSLTPSYFYFDSEEE